jgi:hypothetical protein
MQEDPVFLFPFGRNVWNVMSGGDRFLKLAALLSADLRRLNTLV